MVRRKRGFDNFKYVYSVCRVRGYKSGSLREKKRRYNKSYK